MQSMLKVLHVYQCHLIKEPIKIDLSNEPDERIRKSQ